MPSRLQLIFLTKCHIFYVKKNRTKAIDAVLFFITFVFLMGEK